MRGYRTRLPTQLFKHLSLRSDLGITKALAELRELREANRHKTIRKILDDPGPDRPSADFLESFLYVDMLMNEYENESIFTNLFKIKCYANESQESAVWRAASHGNILALNYMHKNASCRCRNCGVTGNVIKSLRYDFGEHWYALLQWLLEKWEEENERSISSGSVIIGIIERIRIDAQSRRIGYEKATTMIHHLNEIYMNLCGRDISPSSL